MKSGYAARTGLPALALVFGVGLLLAGSNTAFAVGESSAFEFSNASRDAGVTFHSAHASVHTVSSAPASKNLGWAFEWSGASRDAGVLFAVPKTSQAVQDEQEGHPAGDEADVSSGRRAADNRHPSGLSQEDAHTVLGGWFE